MRTRRENLLRWAVGGKLSGEALAFIGGAKARPWIVVSGRLHYKEEALTGWDAVRRHVGDAEDDFNMVWLIAIGECLCEVGDSAFSDAAQSVYRVNSGLRPGVVLHELDERRNGRCGIGSEQCKSIHPFSDCWTVEEVRSPAIAIYEWHGGELFLPRCRLVIYPAKQGWERVCADGLDSGSCCWGFWRCKPIGKRVTSIVWFVWLHQVEGKNSKQHGEQQKEGEHPRVPHFGSV